MLVAVYGTLKKGYGNYHVMEKAEGVFKGKAVTKKDTFIMDGSGFPYIIEDSTNTQKGKVAVELFEVKNIEPLDWLEGHPTFYKREKEKFVTENGDEVDAWIYIYQNTITANKELKQNNIYTW